LDSFYFAFCGLWHIVKNHRNARIILFFGVFAVIFGVVLEISKTEMAIILLISGVVFVGEIFNTMVEDITNLITDREFHPTVKIIKDMSAAAVLFASFISVIIGLLIFGQKIVSLWN
jgi:diacylglycerol kinase